MRQSIGLVMLIVFAQSCFAEVPNQLSRLNDLVEHQHIAIDQALELRKDADELVTIAQFRSTMGFPKACRIKNITEKILDSGAKKFPIVSFDYAITCSNLEYRASALFSYNAKSSKLVIANHGTAGSPESIFDLEPPLYFTVDNDPHHDFAAVYRIAGASVLAPRLVTNFRVDTNGYGLNRNRDQLDKRLQPFGMRLLGVEVTAINLLSDYLANRYDFKEQLTHGLSLGGMISFFQMASNPNIDRGISSNYIEDRLHKFAIRGYKNATWRHVYAGWTIYQGVDKNMSDVSIIKHLIAPRPFLVEVGEKDERSKLLSNLTRLVKKEQVSNICIMIIPGAGHEVELSKTGAFLTDLPKFNRGSCLD